MQVNSDFYRYRYLIVLGFTIISFLFTYGSLQAASDAKYDAKIEHDKLSGEKYSTAGVYNYKDNNPYGSYFVGFDQLTDRGIRNDEWLYISDTLTNFTMYSQKTYNGKISYVKDSFLREDKGSSTFESYSYKFGINSQDIYTMKVQSSWVQEVIRISIINESGKELFFKEFKIY